MELKDKFLDLEMESEIKYKINFQILDCSGSINKIITLFYFKGIPIISTSIDTITLEMQGFAEKNEEIPAHILEQVKIITKKISAAAAFSEFH